MGLSGLLRSRWNKHNQRLMKKALYDESIGGRLPAHREQQLNELAIAEEIGRAPILPSDVGLDVSGNVKPDEIRERPRPGEPN